MACLAHRRLRIGVRLPEAFDEHAAAFAVGQQSGARFCGRGLARLSVVAAQATEVAPQFFPRTILLTRPPRMAARSVACSFWAIAGGRALFLSRPKLFPGRSSSLARQEWLVDLWRVPFGLLLVGACSFFPGRNLFPGRSSARQEWLVDRSRAPFGLSLACARSFFSGRGGFSGGGGGAGGVEKSAPERATRRAPSCSRNTRVRTSSTAPAASSPS